jgi:hypothetical protein
MESRVVRKGITRDEAEAMESECGDIPAGKALRCRLRYFTDGAVIGSRAFVNEAFRAARDRFGPRRKDGARKMRGGAAAWAGKLWSLRDLRAGIG